MGLNGHTEWRGNVVLHVVAYKLAGQCAMVGALVGGCEPKPEVQHTHERFTPPTFDDEDVRVPQAANDESIEQGIISATRLDIARYGMTMKCKRYTAIGDNEDFTSTSCRMPWQSDGGEHVAKRH